MAVGAHRARLASWTDSTATRARTTRWPRRAQTPA